MNTNTLDIEALLRLTRWQVKHEDFPRNDDRSKDHDMDFKKWIYTAFCDALSRCNMSVDAGIKSSSHDIRKVCPSLVPYDSYGQSHKNLDKFLNGFYKCGVLDLHPSVFQGRLR